MIFWFMLCYLCHSVFKCFSVKHFFNYFSLILFSQCLVILHFNTHNVLVYGFHYSYHLLACLKGINQESFLFTSLFYCHAEYIELNWHKCFFFVLQIKWSCEEEGNDIVSAVYCKLQCTCTCSSTFTKLIIFLKVIPLK